MKMAAAQFSNGGARINVYAVLLWLQLPLLGLVFYCAGSWAKSWLDQPLGSVQLSGALVESDAKRLRLQVWDSAEQRYLDIDLAAVKQRLEADPWVREVDVRRLWPAGLAVQVVEEKAVARWGARALLNSDGEVFMPATLDRYQHLPVMHGPEGQVLTMMAQFRALNQLIRPLNLQLASLQLEPRGAWSLTLTNGIQLVLGRGRMVEKVRRFSRVYGTQLAEHASKIKQVDVRYTNGLTVTWQQPLKTG